MPQIIISYRREDSGVITGRIFDRLVARYGRDAIFRDIDNVPIGVDFRTHIDQVLGSSDVVVAVVGPHWAGPARSPSRLGNAADPVRVEIETALRKGAPLIPVLVLGAAMPTVEQLPGSLKDFAYRNAVQLDARQDFDVHMARLTRAIDGILGLTVEAARGAGDEAAAVPTQPAPSKRPRVLIGGSIAALLAMAVAAGWYFESDRQKSLLPTDTAAVAPKVAPPPAISLPSTPPAAPAMAPAPPPIDPEVVFWQSITASKNAADFEEYLRKYPNGQFAGLARNRGVALQPPSAVSAPTLKPPEPDIPAALVMGKRAFDAEKYQEAMRWYREAADRGDATAQNNIGYMYQVGQGVPQDYAEAARWFRKAADRGLPDGETMMGWIYENGDGAPQDYAEAMRWYRRAADQGDASAQEHIGLMYWNGRGVPRDAVQTRYWMQRAAHSGSADAGIWLTSHPK